MGQSSPDGFMGVEKRGLCQRVTPRKWGLIAEQEGYLWDEQCRKVNLGGAGGGCLLFVNWHGMELPKCCVIQHCFTSAYIQIRIYMRIYSYQISPKGTHGIFWGAVLLAVIMTRHFALGIQQNLCCYGLSFPCTNYFLPPWKRGRMAIELGSPLPPVPFQHHRLQEWFWDFCRGLLSMKNYILQKSSGGPVLLCPGGSCLK